MLSLKMNKKGDIPSILYSVAIIFAIGIMLVVVSYLALEIYSSLSDTLNENPDIASSYANETLTTIQAFEQSMWDYFFLAIVLAYVISMFVLAFTTPSNPWLFAIFVVFSSIGLFVGVALSNAWEQFADADILESTIDRFPITDLILNNFYPLFVTLIVVGVMIMLFGKRFLGDAGGGTR